MSAADVDDGWAPICKIVHFAYEEHSATLEWFTIPVRECGVLDERLAASFFWPGTQGIGVVN